MKKFLVLLVMIFASSCAWAKEENDITLKCSYIGANTDLHLALDAITIKENGKVYTNGKYVGMSKVSDDNVIFVYLKKGYELTFDTKNGLSVLSGSVKNTVIESFGSCRIIDQNELEKK